VVCLQPDQAGLKIGIRHGQVCTNAGGQQTHDSVVCLAFRLRDHEIIQQRQPKQTRIIGARGGLVEILRGQVQNQWPFGITVKVTSDTT